MSDAIDRISALPETILERILSFLNHVDQIRVGSLSKTWQLAKESLPALEFHHRQHNYHPYHHYRHRHKKESEIKQWLIDRDHLSSEFVKSVDRSLRCLVNSNLSLQRFSLSICPSCHSSSIDRWIELAAQINVRELFLDYISCQKYHAWDYDDFPKTGSIAANSLTSLKLCGLILSDHSFFHEGKLLFLQRLEMQMVRWEDNFMDDLAGSCPSLMYLSIDNCPGITDLRISGFMKLHTLQILNREASFLGRNIIQYKIMVDEAPNLHTFEYRSFRGCSIELGNCKKNLKVLEVYFASIGSTVSVGPGSEFPLLKTLALFDCLGLKKVQVFGHCIRKLSLFRLEDHVDVTIDASNLRSFRYGSYTSFTNLLPMKITSRLMKTTMKMAIGDFLHVTNFVLELRAYLDNFFQDKAISLRIPNPSNPTSKKGYLYKLIFIPEEARNVANMMRHDVKHLNLKFFSIPSRIDSFVNCLLWNSRPETICTSFGSQSHNEFIKVLCEQLNERNIKDCCKSPSIVFHGSTTHAIKCWRHNLNDVQIEIPNGIESKKVFDCNTFLQSLPTFAPEQEITFKLKWQSFLLH